ncbi:MAG TPA: TauD/TfdA family dioxygenase [Acidimicrobiia bacterium]|nr:TauD/TfdA family dioxygenase [Acidimicrobiia bacterium]
MTITDAVDLDVTPLSATIGAAIRGVDLHAPVSDAVIAQIRECLLRYGVIFLPGQHLGPAEHLEFARRFGEPTPAHPVIPGVPGFPEIFEIDYTKTAKVRETYGDVVDRYDGLSWHTDVTFVERPPLGSILNALVIPPAGGDTMFSDQRAAYESLSAPMRAFLDGLTAVHDGRAAFGALLKRRKDGGGDWDGKRYKALEPSEHPVVRTHPETGRKSLFVNPGFTSHIRGLTRGESNALLQYLYAHSVEPRFTVRYHWSAGDLGFWDNRVTQHSVVGDFTGHRVIQRVTLHGDRPA